MIIRCVFALLFAACAPSFAANDGNRFAASLVPAERFEIGATLVERHGQRGASVILIPGIAGGAWTWQATIRQLMGEHIVYVLTLPGFDGRPAVEGKGLAAAQDTLRELIETRKLGKPALVGHALGGTLALALAAQHPQLVGSVVSIDGLALMPGIEDWPHDERVSLARAAAVRTQASFAARQQQYMRAVGVIDMARADELAKLTSGSDPAAVARYMGDALALDLRAALALDLRAALASIKAPVLLLAPYFDLDAEQQQMTQTAKVDYYRSLMKGTPTLTVAPIAPARHFAMFDQPQMVDDAIAAFLKTPLRHAP